MQPGKQAPSASEKGAENHPHNKEQVQTQDQSRKYFEDGHD